MIIKKKFKNDEEEAERLLFYVVIEKTEKEIFLVALVIKSTRILLQVNLRPWLKFKL